MRRPRLSFSRPAGTQHAPAELDRVSDLRLRHGEHLGVEALHHLEEAEHLLEPRRARCAHRCVALGVAGAGRSTAFDRSGDLALLAACGDAQVTSQMSVSASK